MKSMFKIKDSSPEQKSLSRMVHGDKKGITNTEYTIQEVNKLVDLKLRHMDVGDSLVYKEVWNTYGISWSGDMGEMVKGAQKIIDFHLQMHIAEGTLYSTYKMTPDHIQKFYKKEISIEDAREAYKKINEKLHLMRIECFGRLYREFTRLNETYTPQYLADLAKPAWQKRLEAEQAGLKTIFDQLLQKHALGLPYVSFQRAGFQDIVSKFDQYYRCRQEHKESTTTDTDSGATVRLNSIRTIYASCDLYQQNNEKYLLNAKNHLEQLEHQLSEQKQLKQDLIDCIAEKRTLIDQGNKDLQQLDLSLQLLTVFTDNPYSQSSHTSAEDVHRGQNEREQTRTRIGEKIEGYQHELSSFEDALAEINQSNIIENIKQEKDKYRESSNQLKSAGELTSSTLRELIKSMANQVFDEYPPSVEWLAQEPQDNFITQIARDRQQAASQSTENSEVPETSTSHQKTASHAMPSAFGRILEERTTKKTGIPMEIEGSTSFSRVDLGLRRLGKGSERLRVSQYRGQTR